MSLTNPFGDVEISDPQAMRALAHPVRLAILSFLQRNGPATATVLAPHVGATPSVTSWHLRHLAEFGLVRDADPGEVPGDRRQRWWKAAARGFRVEMGESAESQAAARVLGGEMAAAALGHIDEWIGETEPSLEPEWQRASSVSNTTVSLTRDELATVQSKIDELLGTYVRRGDAPSEARPIRIVRFFMPEAGPLTSETGPLTSETGPLIHEEGVG